jgi:hypothetical protein
VAARQQCAQTQELLWRLLFASGDDTGWKLERQTLSCVIYVSYLCSEMRTLLIASAHVVPFMLGGTPAPSGAGSSAVLFGSFGEGAYARCTGTVVARGPSSTAILTAAHCVLRSDGVTYFDSVYALLGDDVECATEHIPTTPSEWLDDKRNMGLCNITFRRASSVVAFGVESWKSPRDRRPFTFEHDVAVARFDTRFSGIVPAYITTGDVGASFGSAGKIAALGAGLSSTSAAAASSNAVSVAGRIQRGNLSTLSEAECLRADTAVGLASPGTRLCVLRQGTSAAVCVGDSGGGVFAIESNGELSGLIGIITSFFVGARWKDSFMGFGGEATRCLMSPLGYVTKVQWGLRPQTPAPAAGFRESAGLVRTSVAKRLGQTTARSCRA